MALTERLAILVDASTGGAVREFNKLGTAAGQTDRSLTKTQVAAAGLKGAFGAIGLTAVASGIVTVAKASIQAASALEEAESKASVVFGESFPKVSEFAKETANAFNLSERAALDFAGAFAPVFKNAGFGADAVAELSTAMTGFVADFASFNNLTIDEAFTKIQSGLAGETEAVRRFGIDVSAAAVKAEAYAMGIAEVGEELTEAQKVQARTSIIFKDGADAMGDVSRTADSYANTQRDLQENTEDLAAAFGQLLVPEAAEATATLGNLLTLVNQYAGSADDAADSSSDFGDSLSRGLNPVTALWDRFTNLRDSLNDVVSGLNGTAESSEDSADAMYDNAAATLSAGDATSGYASAAFDATAAVEDQTEAISDLADEVSELGGLFRTADEASDDLAKSIIEAREPFQELKEAQQELAGATSEAERTQARQRVETAKAALTLRGNSEAALENRGRLRDLAKQTLETASAYIRLDGDTVRATAATERGREAFIRVADKLGLGEKAAGRYADKLGLVPDKVETNIRLNGVSAAEAAAVGYKGALDAIPRNVVTIIEQRRKEVQLGGPLSGDQSGLRASGGPVSAGRTYMVGENGPELLTLRGGNGIVTSAGKTATMRTQATEVTYNIYAPPDDMLRQIKAAERRRALLQRVA